MRGLLATSCWKLDRPYATLFLFGSVPSNLNRGAHDYHNRLTVRVLSARQIAEGAGKGKVNMGGRDLQQEVDEDEAVAVAFPYPSTKETDHGTPRSLPEPS